MKLGIVKEIRPDERRVAAAPSTVGKWVKAGWEVVVEAGAGAGASFPDDLYRAAGATVLDTAAAVWSQADVVCKVRPPSERAVAPLERRAERQRLAHRAEGSATRRQALASGPRPGGRSARS